MSPTVELDQDSARPYRPVRALDWWEGALKPTWARVTLTAATGVAGCPPIAMRTNSALLNLLHARHSFVKFCGLVRFRESGPPFFRLFYQEIWAAQTLNPGYRLNHWELGINPQPLPSAGAKTRRPSSTSIAIRPSGGRARSPKVASAGSSFPAPSTRMSKAGRKPPDGGEAFGGGGALSLAREPLSHVVQCVHQPVEFLFACPR
jgi:hypothetical protein